MSLSHEQEGNDNMSTNTNTAAAVEVPFEQELTEAIIQANLTGRAVTFDHPTGGHREAKPGDPIPEKYREFAVTYEKQVREEYGEFLKHKQSTALATVTETQIERPQQQTQSKTTSFGGSLTLNTFEEAWRFAKMIAGSDLAPKDYKGKPENVVVAIQMGLEVGLSPMAALQNIAVINGRPSIWGDAALAIVMVHPHYEAHEEPTVEGADDKRTATFKIKRRGHPLHIQTFSVADAKKAKLWGKEGPWSNYPDRMLKLRARGFGLRDKFADALRGLITTEEAIDIPADSYSRHEAAVAAVALELPSDIRRASETSIEPQTQSKPAYNEAATLVELQNKTTRMQQFTALHEQIYKLSEDEASKWVMGGTPEEETAKIEEMKLVLARLQEPPKQEKQENKKVQVNSPKLDFSKR